MTVAASGGAYAWMSQVQSAAQDETRDTLATDVVVKDAICGRGVVRLGLKNRGSTAVSTSDADLYVYEDGNLHTARTQIDLSSITLAPDDFAWANLFTTDVLESGHSYTVELAFPRDDITVQTTCTGFQDAEAAAIWTFDNFQNATAIDTAGDNDGTFKGETFHHADLGGSQSVEAADPAWGDGQFGGGIHFTENQDEVRAGSVLAGGTIHAFTFTAWIYRDTVSGDWQNVIDSGSTRMEFGGGAHDSIGGCIDKNGTVPQQCAWSSDGSLPAGEWHHVAMTYDVDAGSNNLKIYLDGVVVDERTYSYETNVNNYIRMSAEDWTGRLDEVRIYTRALNASEVNASMNSHWPVGDPVASWSFEDGTGQVAHDTHEKVQGVNGGAVTFDGADDHVVVPAVLELNITGSLTVLTWFVPNEVPFDGWGGILEKRRNNPERGGFAILGTNGADTLRFEVVDTGGANNFDSTTTVQTGTWHHAAMVFNSTSGTLDGYLDGAREGSTGATISNHSDADLYIGSRRSGGSPFNGTIDEVQVYPYAVY